MYLGRTFVFCVPIDSEGEHSFCGAWIYDTLMYYGPCHIHRASSSMNNSMLTTLDPWLQASNLLEGDTVKSHQLLNWFYGVLQGAYFQNNLAVLRTHKILSLRFYNDRLMTELTKFSSCFMLAMAKLPGTGLEKFSLQVSWLSPGSGKEQAGPHIWWENAVKS